MKIEIPKIEDLDELNILAKQIHEMHVSWRPDLFINVENPILSEMLEEMIQNKAIFVAKDDNKIVGYIIAYVKEHELLHGYPYSKSFYIDVICVAKSHQHEGVGSALMNHVIEIAKAENCTDLKLTVNEENKNAIKFYEKFGMKIKNITYQMKI